MPKASTAEVDLSEFEEAAGAPKPVKVGCWFSRLTEEQQAKVIAAQGAGYNHVQIGKTVERWGMSVNARTVGEHFRKGCTCGR